MSFGNDHVGVTLLGEMITRLGRWDVGSRTGSEVVALPMVRPHPEFDHLVSGRGGWHRQAACVGHRRDFSPGRGIVAREVFETCEACPVRQECLDDALDVESRLDANQIHGIRGGYTAMYRIALLGKRQGERFRRLLDAAA